MSVTIINVPYYNRIILCKYDYNVINTDTMMSPIK